MEYNTQKIRLRFFQGIVYQAEGVEKHLMLDGDRYFDGQRSDHQDFRRLVLHDMLYEFLCSVNNFWIKDTSAVREKGQ